VQVFNEEGVSGGLIDRPAIKRMLAFLRQHRSERIVVIIDDISRLARDLKAHIELRTAISDAGGVLQSPSIEFGEDSDSRLVENMLASVSQHHRQKNAEQVKNRMRARMMNGYWIMKVPCGYRMDKCTGHGKMLVRDEPLATIIQKGLEGFATDRFSSVVELQAYFEYQPEFPKNRKGGVHIQNVMNILNRLLYTGYFEFPDWGIPLMRGKHEPIISFETYQKIQDKLHGRAKAPARKDLNQDFVLRGFVLCDGCGAPLRSCWSSGRHERYAYYLCHTKGCEHYGKSVRREIIEDSFDALLKGLTPTPAVVEILEDMVVQARDIKFRNHFEILDNLKKEKQLVDRKVDQFLERIVQADSAALITAYERQVRQLEEQRIILEEKIRNCGTVDDSFDEINRTALEFIRNPHERWASADLSGKRLVLKATFARPLAYHRKEGYRTAALSLPFLVLREFSAGKSNMVELSGIEPLASSLRTKRSPN
jgi:site-specific DNA recombinase